MSTRLATAWKSRHKSNTFRGRQTSEPRDSRGRPGLRGRGRGAAGTEWPPAWPTASAQGRANVIKGSSVPPPACPRARRRFPHASLTGRGRCGAALPSPGGGDSELEEETPEGRGGRMCGDQVTTSYSFYLGGLLSFPLHLCRPRWTVGSLSHADTPFAFAPATSAPHLLVSCPPLAEPPFISHRWAAAPNSSGLSTLTAPVRNLRALSCPARLYPLSRSGAPSKAWNLLLKLPAPEPRSPATAHPLTQVTSPSHLRALSLSGNCPGSLLLLEASTPRHSWSSRPHWPTSSLTPQRESLFSPHLTPRATHLLPYVQRPLHLVLHGFLASVQLALSSSSPAPPDALG